MNVNKSTKLRAGEMRHRVTFQQETTVKDDRGGPYSNWGDYKTVWAKVESSVGDHFWGAQQDNPRVDGMISIRYRRDMIRSPLRVRFDGRTYQIIAAADPDGKRHRLNMPYQEIDERDNLVVGGP